MIRALQRGRSMLKGSGAGAATMRVLAAGFFLAATVVVGCGRDEEESTKAPPLRVFAPWPVELRLRRVFERYQVSHPDVRFAVTTGTPGSLVKRTRRGDVPDVFIAMGPVEVDLLRNDALVRDGGQSEIMRQHMVLVCSPAMEDVVKEVKDLAKPEVRKVGMCFLPTLSAGVFTGQALEKAGVLDVVKAKALTPPLRSLLEGKVDAAIALEECCYLEDLLAGKLASLPGIVVVGPLPESLSPEFSISALALKGPARPELAIEFVEYLGEKESQDIFRRRGPGACPS